MTRKPFHRMLASIFALSMLMGAALSASAAPPDPRTPTYNDGDCLGHTIPQEPAPIAQQSLALEA